MAIKRSSTKKNTRKKAPRKTWYTSVKKWSIRLIIGFFGFTITWVLLLSFINPPLTYLQVKRAFERKAAGKEWKLDKKWLNYEDLSDNLKRAAIAGEDAYFISHSGFEDRKSTRLNSSHVKISYAVFCLKK